MLTAVSFTVIFSMMVSCKKTTTNTTVVKDSIYYSPWMDISMAFNSTDSAYEQTISASGLTQSVLSTGAVIGYVGIITATADTAAEAASDFFSTGFDIGQIEFISAYDYSTATTGFFYRYVIIPGTVLESTSLAKLTKTQLQHMSFTDEQKALSTAAATSEGNKFNE
jgi:hypothetical protein